MQGTISKWGNSLALRLPRALAEEAKLGEGDLVDLELDNGVLKIIPSRKKFKLADLLEGESRRSEEDWGPPKGDEAW